MSSFETPRRRSGRHAQAAMARIKASCPQCGDVELGPRQVQLVVCSAPERSTYSFTCTTCKDEVRKHASSEVVDALTTAGVTTHTWVIPDEALQEHAGAAISWDDVLDLRLALDGVDALAALVTGVDDPTRAR